MLINLRNALMAGKRLPYDAEVEYLQSSGTQWIDTGFKANTTTTLFECGIVPLNTSSTQGVFGSRDTSNYATNDANNVFMLNGALRLDWLDGQRTGGGQTYPVSLGEDYSISITRGTAIVNGTTLTSSNRVSVNSSYNFLIGNFTNGSAGAFTTGFIGRWKFAKLYTNGVLVRDFIPVRKGTVGYLYDRVSGKLFGNAGTGDFALGQDVVPVEYLQGDGNAYIDTPIVFNSGTDTVEADFELLVGTVYKWCFGSHDTATRCAVGSGDGINRRNVAYGNGTTQVADSYFLNNRCSFRADVTGAYLNDAKIRNSQNFSATTPMRLFGLHAPNDNGTYASQTRLWSFAVTRSGTSIATYKPVRVGTEGAMMDVLTRRIYRNAGTGAFAYGNDLKYPIPAE